MHDSSFEEALDLVVQRDARFHRDAYVFVREALDHTQKTVVKERRGRSRHVSGQELLSGIRDYALQQFGPMAKTVLNEWGVHTCSDFGNLVFNMVEVRILAKTDNDTHADFEQGYDFHEAFELPFLPPSRRSSLGRQITPAPEPSGN